MHIAHLQKSFSTLRKYIMKLNPSKFSFEVSYKNFMTYIVTHHGIKTKPETITPEIVHRFVKNKEIYYKA